MLVLGVGVSTCLALFCAKVIDENILAVNNKPTNPDRANKFLIIVSLLFEVRAMMAGMNASRGAQGKGSKNNTLVPPPTTRNRQAY
jgi:hypothetical protein